MKHHDIRNFFEVLTLASIVGAASLIATPAMAQLGPTPYLDFNDSPFASLSFAYFYLEDFEDNSFNVPGVTRSGGTINAPGSFTDSVEPIDACGQGRSLYFNTCPFTITFDELTLGVLPTHVGVVWTDGDKSAVVEFFDASENSLGTVSPGIAGNAGGTCYKGEDRFAGAVSNSGIKRIEIRGASGPCGAIEIDHVQYGFTSVVPVESSAWGAIKSLYR